MAVRFWEAMRLQNSLGNKMFKSFLGLIFIVMVRMASASDYLPTWQAFQVQVEPSTQQALWVKFTIAPEYHIYQDKIKISALADSSVKLGQPVWPDPIILKSTDLGEFKVYENTTGIQVPISNYGNGKLKIQINYQGCKGLDLCFPEQQQVQEIDLNHPLSAAVVSGVNQAAVTNSAPGTLSEVLSSSSDSSRLASLLQGNWSLVILGFFALGLLIAFTPCVFPLLPILIGVISGVQISTRRSFWLALSYILGGAVTYAIAGVIAASIGYSLAGALQSAWLSWVLVILFSVLALSLFGFFELQLPLALQNQLNRLISRRKSGSILGAFMIGGISNLVLSPCVTAPLAGALVYISTTGNQWLGAAALFALGFGSGLPLLLIAVFGKSLLPKTGAWMLQVKKVLAVLMLAMAVYMLSKVVTSQISEIAYLLWAMVVVSLIVNLAVTTRKTQYVLSAALSCGLVLSYIAYSDFFRTRATLQESFTVVTTSTSLERILAQAKLDKRPVLLDYYASWCVACKEMDIQTFSDPLISQKLKDFTLIRVDVSDNNAQTKLLQQRYQVIAPPSLVFIDGSGQVLDNFKVTGFIASDKLGLNLQAIMTDQLKLRGCDATTMNC